MDGSASAAFAALWVRLEWRTQRLARPAQGCAGGRTSPWMAQPIDTDVLVGCIEAQSAHRIRPAHGCAGGSRPPWMAQPQLRSPRFGSALNGGPSGWLGPRMDARAGVDRHGWLSPRSTEAKPCRVRVSRTTPTRELGLRSGIRVSRNCRCATGAPYAHIVSGFGWGLRVSRNCRCATGAPYAHIGFGFDSVMASVPIASARFQTLVSLIETSDSQRVSRFPR